jgi:hypothetical protein
LVVWVFASTLGVYELNVPKDVVVVNNGMMIEYSHKLHRLVM